MDICSALDNIRKSYIEIFLSKLKGFEKPKVKFEQYITPSNIAAEILWFAYMHNDIGNKIVADLGAGTGILGIGALLLKAKKVYFVEKDKDAIVVLEENLKTLKNAFNLNFDYDILNIDVTEFDEKVNTTIMNPPFGVKRKHADLPFIEVACKISNVIYSIHKAETFDFVRKYYEKLGFKITHYKFFKYPIKATYDFHEKPKVFIDAVWIRCEK